MKRNYVTPVRAMESYNLTQSIAGCITKIGALDSQCVLEDPDSTDLMVSFAAQGWFTDAGNCTTVATDMDGFDTICYHTSVQAAFVS